MKKRPGVKIEEAQELRLRRMGCLMFHRRLWMERSGEFIARIISRVRRVGQRDLSESTPIIIAEFNTGNHWLI